MVIQQEEQQRRSTNRFTAIADLILNIIKTWCTHAHFILLIVALGLILFKNPHWATVLKMSMALLVPALGIPPYGLVSSSSSDQQEQEEQPVTKYVPPKTSADTGKKNE